jgi:RNA polymerase sigma factor (sigma-70 family)
MEMDHWADRRGPRSAAPPVDSMESADLAGLVEVDLDREPYEEFYRREFPRIRGLARVLTGPVAADDVAQEAMLVAYRRWREVSAMSDPAMWVRRVCANLATSALRRRGVEARAMMRLGSRAKAPAVVLDPVDEHIWSAVRNLPRRQAQVVALFYFYDLTVADVAMTLELSEGSVKTHLSRGRQALGARLHDLGLDGGELA